MQASDRPLQMSSWNHPCWSYYGSSTVATQERTLFETSARVTGHISMHIIRRYRTSTSQSKIRSLSLSTTTVYYMDTELYAAIWQMFVMIFAHVIMACMQIQLLISYQSAFWHNLDISICTSDFLWPLKASGYLGRWVAKPLFWHIIRHNCLEKNNPRNLIRKEEKRRTKDNIVK